MFSVCAALILAALILATTMNMLCIAKLRCVWGAILSETRFSSLPIGGKSLPASADSRPMLVVIHDFAPVFLRELNVIVETLHPIVGWQMSAAVVPRWHGSWCGNTDEGYRELLGAVQERLLHGWTHQSRFSFHPISLLTGQADELRGLRSTVIIRRIHEAQAEFTELTKKPAEGFLPPAWQLPIRSTELSSFRFVMRYRSLECCHDPNRARSLATWSWDWGRFGWLSWGGELLGTLQLLSNSKAIPCIAIHPMDVRRGCLPRAARLIRRLMEGGCVPTTATRLMSEEGDNP